MSPPATLTASTGLPPLRTSVGRQRDPRALARLDAVGVALPGVEALEPRAEPDAGLARDARPTSRWAWPPRRCPEPSATRQVVVSCAGPPRPRRGVDFGQRAPCRRRGSPGPLLERGVLQVDQRRGAARRTSATSELRERHVREERVGVVDVAVGEGQLQRLDRRRGSRRAGCGPSPSRSKPSRSCRVCEQVGPLRPGAALVDGVAAVLDRDRLLDAGDVRGQVAVADQAAVGAATRRRSRGRSGRGRSSRRPAGGRGGGRRASLSRPRPAGGACGRGRRARPARGGRAGGASGRPPRRRCGCRSGRARSGRRRARRGPPPTRCPWPGMPPGFGEVLARRQPRGRRPGRTTTSTTPRLAS